MSKLANNRVIMILILATLCKAILVVVFYQHVVKNGGQTSKLVGDFGWGQLVSSMQQGKYEMVSQPGLSDLYDLSSKSLRPPIYAALLYVLTFLTKHSAIAIVLVQSIITSFVAYLGYLFVKMSTKREIYSIVCLCVLFVFPMNFLKSGTTDEAPLMLVFLLAALYLFQKYVNNPRCYRYLVVSGILLGLSTMTRYTTLPVALGFVLFCLLSGKIEHKYNSILIFSIAYGCILLPWIIRNYQIYGEPVLYKGGGRLLLVTQSEEFIKSYPYESPDSIERRYLREYHKTHSALSELDAVSLDQEFKRLATLEACGHPQKYVRAIITKLKVFIPWRYYPAMSGILRNVVYVSWYAAALGCFLISFLKGPIKKTETVIILITIVSLVFPSLIYFVLSRHLYPVIVLMIIYSLISFSNNCAAKCEKKSQWT